MADAVRMVLDELLRKAEADPGLDVLCEGVWVLAEAPMELEVTEHVGAERHVRSQERTGQRNRCRERALGHAGGHGGAARAAGTRWELLPGAFGAADAGGAGASGGGAGSLRHETPTTFASVTWRRCGMRRAVFEGLATGQTRSTG